MANAEPPGSTPSSSSTHGSRKDEEKNVDDEEIFDPTDDEIIENYLKKRVEGQLPPMNFIKEEDDAFTTSPAQLFQKYGMKMEDKGYFFSPLKENVEMKIATDGGFWKYRENFELPVIDMNGSMKILGRTKFLDFFENNQAYEELKTNWIMQEYSLQSNVPEAENPIINKMEGERKEEAEGEETEEETKGEDVEEEAKRKHENAKYTSLELQGNIPNKVGDIVLCKILYDTEKKSETKVDNEDISAPVANAEIVAPTNEQIGQAAPSNSPIDTDDAFISPVELFRRHGIGRDDVGLFYSPQKESFERRIPTDDGFWKYKNRMFTIPGVLISRPLDYFEKNQAGEELKTKWVMEELSLPPDAPEAEDVGDIVLCKIQYGTQVGDEEAQGEGEADIEEENQRDDDNVDAQTASSSEGVHSDDDTSPQHSGYGENQLDDDNVEEDEEAQGEEVEAADKEDESQAEEVEADKEDIFVPVDNVDILNDHLNKRVQGQLTPYNTIIDTDDAFISPVELFRRHGIERDDRGVFFSPLKESFERRIPTDDGFWKYRNHMFTLPKIDVNGIKRIASRIKPLDYFEINQAGEEVKTKWVMQEHSLPPDVPEAEDEIASGILVSQATAPTQVGDIVLCEIQYDAPNLKKPGSRAEKVEEEEEAQGEGEAKKKKIKLKK